jgi:hypothetical protein
MTLVLFETDKIVELFLKSRKSTKTQGYVRVILEYLEQHPSGVRANEFMYAIVPDKIPNQSSFLHLVSDLIDYGLIEKYRGPSPDNRKAVYYKLGWKE